MIRMASTTRLDIKIQARSKLYLIAILVAVVTGLIVRIIVPQSWTAFFVPIFYLSAVGSTAYMFIGGMVIFEKDEGTLAAQIVTPLRMNEYLWAKTLSLLIVVLIESLLVLFLGYGVRGYNLAPLLLGIMFLSMGLTLTGFVQVSRFDSVTDFIVYAVPVIMLLQLPILDYAGIVPSLVWYVIPSMAPLLLISTAFSPIEKWQWVYALTYSVVAIAILFWWARHAFQRNIVMRGI